MKKTGKIHRTPTKLASRWGIWIVALGILLGLATYAADHLPSSEAATGPKIKFITPANTEDLDMSSKYLVKFSVLDSVPGSPPIAIDFHVRDEESNQYALISRMILPAGQRSGSFSWHVGYDLTNKRIWWLPKNNLYMTAKILNGNVSALYTFHVVPADDGTGLPIVYLIDPNKGPDGYGPDGPYKIAIHGRNLTSKKGVSAVLFTNRIVTKPGVMALNGYTSRRLTVSPPKWGSEPMVVDVIVTTDKGTYTVKNGFEFISRI